MSLGKKLVDLVKNGKPKINKTMKQFKITVGDKSQITSTGVELYTTILKKFGVEYTIEEINNPKQKSLFDNDIPHSEIRRMESEGVYEEKFSDENSSSDSYEHSEYYWDTDRNTDIQDFEIESSKMHQPVYFNEEWNQSNTGGVEVKYIYEPNKPL